MKTNPKVSLVLIVISTIITGILYHYARGAAIAARGTSTAFGGEVAFWLIPYIVWMFYKNIVLNREVFKK